MSELDRAIVIATEAHSGQRDRGGAPYILHPLRVMMAVETDEQRIVAVLHDVLEDCPEWNPARLICEGFSPNVISALMTLTKRSGETYEGFIERVKVDPLAVRVKLADLADNSDLSRLKKVTDKDRERHAKYQRAIATLASRLG